MSPWHAGRAAGQRFAAESGARRGEVSEVWTPGDALLLILAAAVVLALSGVRVAQSMGRRRRDRLR